VRKRSDFLFSPFSREVVSRIWRDEIWTMEIPDGVTFNKNGVWPCYEHQEKAKEISYLQVWIKLGLTPYRYLEVLCLPVIFKLAVTLSSVISINSISPSFVDVVSS
jgi:hypothetical protein